MFLLTQFHPEQERKCVDPNNRSKAAITKKVMPRFDSVEVKLATELGEEIKICQVGLIYTLIYPYILLYTLINQHATRF